MIWYDVKDKLPENNKFVIAILKEPRERLNYPRKEQILILWREESHYFTDDKKIMQTTNWVKPFSGELSNYNNEVIYWSPISLDGLNITNIIGV